jgi:hypothetical protein
MQYFVNAELVFLRYWYTGYEAVRMPAELASSRGLIIKRLTVFRVIFCP